MRWLLTLLAVLCTLPALADPVGPPPRGLSVATFAGGCFWCMEQAFDEVDGVRETLSGYTGGHVADPGYHQVSAGGTGHAESERVYFDPGVVTYSQLLDHYWHNIDPTVTNRQFCDRGTQYRSVIFYHTPEQKRLAEESKRKIADSGQLPGPIMTTIEPAGPFYAAEDYHQNFYRKNPARYKFYKKACGREARLQEIWGDQAG